ncbi:DEKNAAC104888 [Brettanomyces naardenensis]|uniref:RING-type E3 ubiquitin transferase n=1 Tax=Brettanomyces naardenensis TaxID=13370 RepID=A0A448YRY1_BRENA|nr:DEKNAAC104888 [Brettanomyces naardenensis]
MGQSFSRDPGASPADSHPVHSASGNLTGQDIYSTAVERPSRSRRLSSFSLGFSRKHRTNRYLRNLLSKRERLGSHSEDESGGDRPGLLSSFPSTSSTPPPTGGSTDRAEMRSSFEPSHTESLIDSGDSVDSDTPSPLPDSLSSTNSRHSTILLNPGYDNQPTYPPPGYGYGYIPERPSLPSLPTTPNLPLPSSASFSSYPQRSGAEPPATSALPFESHRHRFQALRQQANAISPADYYARLRRTVTDPNATDFDGFRRRRRRRIINGEYESIVHDLDAGMVVQFQTLSTLLETVTVSTLHRLLQNEEGLDLSETDDILGVYNGTRIDRSSPANEDNIEDSTFTEFLDGLRTEHLLQRELGSQMRNNRNLSFFRAFRFSNRDQTAEDTPHDTQVPVLIVGLVSINSTVGATGTPAEGNQSPSDNDTISAESIISQATSPYDPTGIPLNGAARNGREDANTPSSNTYSWIIIVMAHHYSTSDTVLGAMPLFINLLTSYVASSNGNMNTEEFDGPSMGSNNLDDFRNSLFQMLNRSHKLTRRDLEAHTESICVFRTSPKSGCSWKERTNALEEEAYYDEGDRCPICMIEYEDGDPGRKLKCKHAFHRACVDEWLVNDNTCPICRAKAL